MSCREACSEFPERETKQVQQPHRPVDSRQNRRQRILAITTVLGVLVVLSLMAVGVERHPASVQGAGSGLLRMDIALLLVYGVAGV